MPRQKKRSEFQLPLIDDASSGAIFSECGKYRYLLWRRWDITKPIMTLCLVNPSTAGKFDNDQTVSRCVNRAKRLGFGGIRIVNLFAFQSSDPEQLYSQIDPIGPENDLYIEQACRDTDLILCGWGNHGNYQNRGKDVLERMVANGNTPMGLSLNIDGSPTHPLYLAYALKPFALSMTSN